MSSAQILSGSFPQGSFVWDSGRDVKLGQTKGYAGESLKGKVSSVQVITEENSKQLLGALGMSAMGFAVGGLVGGVAGALVGGNKREMLFVCQLKDSRSFLAKGENKIFELLLADSLMPESVAAAARDFAEFQPKSFSDSTIISSPSATVVAGDLPMGTILKIHGGLAKMLGDDKQFHPVGRAAYKENVVFLKEHQISSICLQNGWRNVDMIKGEINQRVSDYRFPIFCQLENGQKFIAVGGAELYHALRPMTRGRQIGLFVVAAILVGIIIFAISTLL